MHIIQKMHLTCPFFWSDSPRPLPFTACPGVFMFPAAKKDEGVFTTYSLGQLAFRHVLWAFERAIAYSAGEGNILQLRRCYTVLCFLQLVVVDPGVFNNNN